MGELDQHTVDRRWSLAMAERDVLIGLARRRGLASHDAEDCVHEAMLRVVPRPDLDEDRIGALLTTVVMRSTVDVHRRSHATGRVVQRLVGLAPIGWADGDPAALVCDRDEARWSARLVDRLPSAQRRALLARAEGSAVHDIAREMRTTSKAVESLISRARAATRAPSVARLGAL